MRYIVLIIIILSFWLFAGGFITEIKNRATYALSQSLLWPKRLLEGEEKALKLENENLKAEIFALKQKYNIQNDNSDLLPAKVHSSYPFNEKNILSINKGSKDGVKMAMPVVVASNILLGKVEDVFDNYSLVKTIFSSDWQLPVRIGEDGIEALLNGGSNPKVNMIIKDKKVTNGQIVFAASKDFPYGIKIGELQNVKQGVATGIFSEADVKVPYSINDITEVWLYKSF